MSKVQLSVLFFTVVVLGWALSRTIKTSNNYPPAGVNIIAKASSTGANVPLVLKALTEKKTVLVAGMSLMGKEGTFVRTVTVMRALGETKPGETQSKGWSQFIGIKDPELSKLTHFDSIKSLGFGPALPNTMIYLVAEVPDFYAEQNVPDREIKELFEYALKQIHD